MKKILMLSLCSILLVSGLVAFSFGKYSKNLHREFTLKDETLIKARIEFGAGEFILEKTNHDKIIVAAEYDPDYLKYRLNYEPIKGIGEFYLKCKTEEGDIDWDEEKNNCDLSFSPKFPLDLKVEIGAAKADFNFSGLKIKNLDMEIGAANAVVRFDQPNPIKMQTLKLEAGASKLKILGLGNANFEKMRFEGGVGNFVLDFSGELDHSAVVNIELGLGKITIKVPRNFGVKIESEKSFLSHISIDEDDFREVDSNVYQTKNYGKTKGELNLYIEVGMGSVEVERGK
jgi:hypothetical protein